MNKKESIIISLLFSLVFIFMIIVNYLNESQWIIDNLLSLLFLFVIILLRKWIKIGRASFLMLGYALILHNLGMFGLYEWEYGIIGYDSIVHFFSSFIAAYIVFNFTARRFHIRKNKALKKTVVDDHLFILILFVISSVVMFGVCIELLEFFGYSFFGSGEGILFFGFGDSFNGDYCAGEYVDVMSDIFVNVLGAFSGVLFYYHTKYKKRPWL